jgi:hypothetical protein
MQHYIISIAIEWIIIFIKVPAVRFTSIPIREVAVFRFLGTSTNLVGISNRISNFILNIGTYPQSAQS